MPKRSANNAPRREAFGREERLAAIAISGDGDAKVIQMPKSLGDSELEGHAGRPVHPFPMEEVSYDFQVIQPSRMRT